MSGPSDTRYSLFEFLNSFLQERNIRWILFAGLAILFGSSVMLVTTHWQEAGPIWKYLVFLGYTFAIFVCGQHLCPRLGLERTATILRALVVLLLPVTFVTWRWTWPLDDGGLLAQITSGVLLIANASVAAYAGRKTIHYLLRDDQWTFLVSYLLLCLAGAALPECPRALFLPASVVLWSIFTIGAVKVNRHVFWLTEELRLPRIFGFFPILLLASQFAGLIAFCVAPHVSIAWLGPLCVLVSLTILFTADALAQVFEQRTGGLVWPWPLSIALPMLVGLVMCAAGVVLAACDVALVRDGRALVFAAGLAAFVMQRVARRTGREMFVYAMLLFVTVAYNFLPSLAIETARMVVAQSAQAVHEQRLPLAFYGLTYLPLLGGLLAAAAVTKRRGNSLFARPIEQYIAFLCWLLLALGATHAKALAGVGLALTAVFAMNNRLFPSRLSMAGTIAAWLLSCAGAVPFARAVLELDFPRFAPFIAMAVGAAGLSVAAAFRRRAHSEEYPYYQAASLTVSMGMAVGFPIIVVTDVVTNVLRFNSENISSEVNLTTWGAGLAIAGLMLVHSFRWRRAAISTATVLYLQVVMALIAIQCEVSFAQMLPLATIGLAAQWVVSRILNARPTMVVSQIFAVPLAGALTLELSAALALGWLPLYVLSLAGVVPWAYGALTWAGGVSAIVWAFDQAITHRHWFSALLGMLAVLGMSCTVFMDFVGPEGDVWLPVVCGATALVGIPIAEMLRRATSGRSIEDTLQDVSVVTVFERPLIGLMLVTFVALATWSVIGFNLPSLVGQGVAAAGFFWFAQRARNAIVRSITAAILSWQVVLLPLHFVGLPGQSLSQLHWSAVRELCFPVGLLAAALCAAWTILGRRDDEDLESLSVLQQMVFGLLAIVANILALGFPQATSLQMAISLLTPLVLASAQAYQAWRDQTEACVWSALAFIVATLLYVAHWQFLHFGGQFAMFAVFTSGVVTWSFGMLLARQGRLRIFARPLRQVGYALPALNLIVAIYREFTLANPHWVGPATLAMFLSAAFYFWRGLEERRPGFVVLAATIANVGLFLVWHELKLTNPQCYMIPLGGTIVLLVELLRRETPPALRDPCRYFGAIVILVSPVFDMFDGSWLPFLTLMLAAVLVLLVAIGLRVRALMYTSVGFLIADLTGMVVRGCVDHPQLLWMAGLGVGTAVVVTGAVCELKRETLLARVRTLSAALETWH